MKTEDKPQPTAPLYGWWSSGYLEGGWRFFGNQVGRENLAKYYEYRTLKPGAGGDDGCGLAETAERLGRFFDSFLQLRGVGAENDSHCTDISHATLPLPPCSPLALCTTSTLAR